jgi:hypothetical protein
MSTATKYIFAGVALEGAIVLPNGRYGATADTSPQ